MICWVLLCLLLSGCGSIEFNGEAALDLAENLASRELVAIGKHDLRTRFEEDYSMTYDEFAAERKDLRGRKTHWRNKEAVLRWGRLSLTHSSSLVLDLKSDNRLVESLSTLVRSKEKKVKIRTGVRTNLDSCHVNLEYGIFETKIRLYNDLETAVLFQIKIAF